MDQMLAYMRGPRDLWAGVTRHRGSDSFSLLLAARSRQDLVIHKITCSPRKYHTRPYRRIAAGNVLEYRPLVLT
jgi:hypothetical protein